jgi:CubicO group peptidase (beta-lactamase class C family)
VRRGFDGAPVPLGSVRKWLTAALAMTGVDRGELSLDTPAGALLPAWDLPDRRGVTLRRLLSHTAGLRSRPRHGWCRDLRTLAACVDRMAEAPLADPPGERFRYSSAGFQVAARMIEVAGGAPYPELLAARLVDPLGLADTRLEPAGAGLADMTGEVWTPVPSFARFLQMLLGGGALEGRRILSPGAVEVLLAGHADQPVAGLVPPAAWWPPGYAYYALGAWRNLASAQGVTQVASAEGKGPRSDGPPLYLVAWIDRRVGRFGVVAMARPRGARPRLTALIDATCATAGHPGEPVLAPSGEVAVEAG